MIGIDIHENGKTFKLVAGPMLTDKLKAIPGMKYRAARKEWELPLSYVAWVRLWNEFSDIIRPTDEVKAWVAEQYKREMKLWELRRDTDAVGSSQDGRQLRPAQFQACRWVRRAGNAIIGDEPGSGKTVMTSVLLDSDYQDYLLGDQEQPYRALVVCPKNVIDVWVTHIEEWTPLKAIPAQDTAGKRRKAIDEWAQDGGVLIMNYQSAWRHTRLAPYGSLRMSRCEEHGGRVPDAVKPASCHVHLKELDVVPHIDYMVLDESQRIKDPKANQTRGIWWLGTRSKRRLALSGTPIDSKPDQLWSTLHFLDPNAWPARGQFLDAFCLMQMNYATDTEFVVGLKNQEEFYRMRDLYMIRRSFAEVTGRDIEKVRTTHTAYLKPKHRKQYKALQEEAYIETEHGGIVIESDLVASTRLLQCASAKLDSEWYTDDDGEEQNRVWMTDESPKVDLLLDVWKNDLDRQPLVVMAGGPGSRQLIDIACARFKAEGIPFSKVVGGMTGEDRKLEVELYMRGDTMVIFGQTTAAGEGLNLDRGNALAFIQRPWSFIENDQAENRVRRESQAEDTVYLLDFVTDDTFDQRVQEVYLEKKEGFDEVMQDLRAVKELL